MLANLFDHARREGVFAFEKLDAQLVVPVAVTTPMRRGLPPEMAG